MNNFKNPVMLTANCPFDGGGSVVSGTMMIESLEFVVWSPWGG